MEDTAMKKKYMKPSFRVVELQHRTCLLSGSHYDATPPNEIHDYDDWFGSRRFKGGWDDDWEEE